MASISSICKKCKNFISALKSPTYIDFMIKKSKKSKTSKSHTWAPLSGKAKECPVSNHSSVLIGLPAIISYVINKETSTKESF
jgi:hypothetical protein